MHRFKLTIEYDGRFFCGWQRQKKAFSVQEAIEKALYSFCKQQQILVYGAGRTDAGVHALGQVAHVDLEKNFPPYRIMDALNYYLRAYPVAILKVESVSLDFHARFSAKLRKYQYQIINRRAPLVLEAGRAWHVIKPLDADKMHCAAQLLVGLHDFNSFRALRCQAASSIRRLDSFTVVRHGDLITLEVQSRSFLHNQVRIMVGSLALIGEGKWTNSHITQALTLASRQAAGPTAPPDGLYFSQIVYEDNLNQK